MEWQPLDSGRVSVPVSPSVWPFSQFLCDVGKRVGRGMPISPSVLWSPRSECIIAERNMIVTGMSPSRTAYGTDVAARFVRNRGDAGVPFWILRVDLAPGDRADNHCLRALAKLLDTRSNSSASDACLFTTIAVPQTRSRIAVVLHLYYPEIWLELWSAVSQLPERFDLYVSCPFRLLPAVQQIVRAVCPTAVVFGVHNLGRDVLPFLLWLRAVGSEPYSYVLKLHSKRSKHLVETEQRVLGDGNAWRAQAVASLVGDRSCATRILAALDSQADVGLVGPSGHMFDQQEWRCATEDLLVTLMSRLGVDAEVRGNFPAGTMFWARGAVLQPLAKISEELMDFEREAGQVDGTLHHAYERAIALLTLYAGYRVIGTDELVDRSPARLT